MGTTRHTLGQTKEALEFMTKLDQLTEEKRDHLRLIFKGLVDCCLDDKMHGVVVLGHEDHHANVFTLNCNEMDAAFILSQVTGSFNDKNMEDAPAKEMFN
jgi:predicted nucleotidyltransferase